MYVITQHDLVVLGPMQWNTRMFNSVIEDDCDTIVNIKQSDVNRLPLIFENNIKIRRCVESRSAMNEKTQMYGGPFWSFTDTTGRATYTTINKPIELVRENLKKDLASNRYRVEVSGVKTIIQGLEVTVETDRESRNIFVQQLLLMPDNGAVKWKFPEGWLSLNKSELGVCVAAGVAHVQAAFSWESEVVALIESATIETILGIDIGDANLVDILPIGV